MTLHYSSPACSTLNQLRRDLHDARRRLSMHNGTMLQGMAMCALNKARAKLRRYAYAQRGRKVAQRIGYDFESTVAGIPCGVYVTSHHGETPDTFWEPGEPAEAEFTITDKTGYEAGWLHDKMTKEDEQRIESECIEHINSLGGDEV